MTRHGWIVAGALLMAGCNTTGTNVSDETLAGFTAGQTTRSEVIGQLGKPSTDLERQDGTHTVVYEYEQYRTKPDAFVPFLGVFSDDSSELDFGRVIMQFDADDRLQSYTREVEPAS